MGRKEDNIKRATEVMHELPQIRNLCIAAHIDHGKTTLSDNLIAGAGMMSEELAGKSRVLDFDEQESARGITINAASASMVHSVEGTDFLINLIDTPGHVDFGGDVTRAMRAVDGCFILACAVEGPMPQTETVVRQALKEKVKPVLFINKVDRLINELQVTPEDMMERFKGTITKVNRLIKQFAPEEKKKEWQVSVGDGTVAFGSAYHNWGITVPFMQKTGISFKDIFEHCHNEQQRELSQKAPVHQVLLDMAVTKLPGPVEAQKYRIPNIWQGDLESPIGKAMINCDPKGDLAMMITKIWMDPHAGEVELDAMVTGKADCSGINSSAATQKKRRLTDSTATSLAAGSHSSRIQKRQRKIEAVAVPRQHTANEDDKHTQKAKKAKKKKKRRKEKKQETASSTNSGNVAQLLVIDRTGAIHR